jgi:hypothetical protein
MEDIKDLKLKLDSRPIAMHDQSELGQGGIPSNITCGPTVVWAMGEGYTGKDLSGIVKNWMKDNVHTLTGEGSDAYSLAALVYKINKQNGISRRIDVYADYNALAEANARENMLRDDDDKIKTISHTAYKAGKGIEMHHGNFLKVSDIYNKVSEGAYVIFEYKGHWLLAYGTVDVYINNSFKEKLLLIFDPESTKSMLESAGKDDYLLYNIKKLNDSINQKVIDPESITKENINSLSPNDVKWKEPQFSAIVVSSENVKRGLKDYLGKANNATSF